MNTPSGNIPQELKGAKCLGQIGGKEVWKKGKNYYRRRGTLVVPIPNPETPRAERVRSQKIYVPAPVQLERGDVRVVGRQGQSSKTLIASWIAPCRCQIADLAIHIGEVERFESFPGQILAANQQVGAFEGKPGSAALLQDPVSLQQFELLNLIAVSDGETFHLRNVWVTFTFDNKSKPSA